MKATEERGFPVPFDVPREPLTERRMLRMRHILILVDKCPMTSAYLSFLLLAMLDADLWMALRHSSPMPPKVENTIGVKVLFST